MSLIDQISGILSNLFGFVQPLYIIIYAVLVGVAIALAFTKKVPKSLAYTIAILPVGIFLLSFMVVGVKKPIDEQAEIDAIEKKVISKLTLIRDVQEEMFKQKGMYARTPEALIEFFNNGKVPIVEKKEKDYGKDSVVVTVDTLDILDAKDVIMNKIKDAQNAAKTQIELDHLSRVLGYAKDFANIAYIPSNSKEPLKFEWFADTIIKSGVKVHVIEIKDVAPVNPKRGGTIDPMTRKTVAEQLARLNKKKNDTLLGNIKIVEDKRRPFLKDSRAIRNKMKKLEEEKQEKSAEYIALVKEFAPFKKELDPLETRLKRYKGILKEIEDKITVLKEKPLRIGSRVDPTTSGNWQ